MKSTLIFATIAAFAASAVADFTSDFAGQYTAIPPPSGYFSGIKSLTIKTDSTYQIVRGYVCSGVGYCPPIFTLTQSGNFSVVESVATDSYEEAYVQFVPTNTYDQPFNLDVLLRDSKPDRITVVDDNGNKQSIQTQCNGFTLTSCLGGLCGGTVTPALQCGTGLGCSHLGAGGLSFDGAGVCVVPVDFTQYATGSFAVNTTATLPNNSGFSSVQLNSDGSYSLTPAFTCPANTCNIVLVPQTGYWEIVSNDADGLSGKVHLLPTSTGATITDLQLSFPAPESSSLVIGTSTDGVNFSSGAFTVTCGSDSAVSC